jgi:hypothetical protein
MVTDIDRGGDCGSNIPSGIDAMPQGLVLHSDFPRPSGERLRSPVMRVQADVPLVVRLLANGGPHAVHGRVRAFIVSPFNGMLPRRAPAHIGEKLLKRIKPSLTDNNPSPAIVLVRAAGFVIAASFHACINAVFIGSGESMGGELRGGKNPRTLFHHTSARLRCASGEGAAHNQNLFAAVALAMPSRLVALVGAASNYCQAGEFLTGQIFKRAHAFSSVN